MENQIEITPQGEYLYVQVTGTGTYESAVQMWSAIARACEQHQCFKVLGEQNLKGTVTTLEALDHPAIFKRAGITENHRIAWVDKNPRTRETTAFIRDILTNRAVGNGRLFTNIEDARRWLLGASEKPSAPLSSKQHSS